MGGPGRHHRQMVSRRTSHENSLRGLERSMLSHASAEASGPLAAAHAANPISSPAAEATTLWRGQADCPRNNAWGFCSAGRKQDWRNDSASVLCASSSSATSMRAPSNDVAWICAGTDCDGKLISVY